MENASIIVGISTTIFNIVISALIYKYKKGIEAEFNIRVERMKIQYSGLYKRRVQAIEDIYAKLYKIKEFINDIHNAESIDEFHDNMDNFDTTELKQLIDELKTFNLSKRIYLDESTYKRLKEFTDYFVKKIIEFNEEQANSSYRIVDAFALELSTDTFWTDIFETIVNDFQQLIGSVEDKKSV